MCLAPDPAALDIISTQGFHGTWNFLLWNQNHYWTIIKPLLNHHKRVRCNPDVAPRLNSDKLMLLPQSTCLPEGGAGFLSLIKISWCAMLGVEQRLGRTCSSLLKPNASISQDGGFLKYGYPQIIQFNGISLMNHPLLGTPILGNPQIIPTTLLLPIAEASTEIRCGCHMEVSQSSFSYLQKNIHRRLAFSMKLNHPATLGYQHLWKPPKDSSNFCWHTPLHRLKVLDHD